jgi:glucokinase
MTTGARLLADIGGTNARFALADSRGIPAPSVLPVADHATFDRALGAFLADHPHVPVGSCAIAAAGPVGDGTIRLTNAPWVIESASLADTLGCPVGLLNDLEAVACALPRLGPDDLDILRAGTATTRAPMIAVNVGTGFGAAVAVPVGRDDWHPLATEPGHMLLPDGRTTVEDVLSGPGLAALRQREDDPRAGFSALLGRVTRDLVLATGAWGGVRFCGGVLEDWDRAVDTEAFLGAFDRPGPMADRLSRVSLARISHGHPALLGLFHVRVG